MLATHFVEKLSRKLNVPPPQLTQANILDLQSYDWPGNVRELENTVERAIILSRSTSLNFSAMPDLTLTDTEPQVDRAANPQNRETVLSADAMQQFERQNTINALKQCRWKIYGSDGAAHLLGIKPTTLIERMKRMRIRKPSKKASEAH